MYFPVLYIRYVLRTDISIVVLLKMQRSKIKTKLQVTLIRKKISEKTNLLGTYDPHVPQLHTAWPFARIVTRSSCRCRKLVIPRVWKPRQATVLFRGNTSSFQYIRVLVDGIPCVGTSHTLNCFLNRVVARFIEAFKARINRKIPVTRYKKNERKK